MKSVYEVCPSFENELFLLRPLENSDVCDLVEVYSDKTALPYFNCDNCHGDNFYYPDIETMTKALDFWINSYKNRWFVRWTIVDKLKDKAIGTIELFHREAEDSFNHVGVLRIDLGSAYEEKSTILSILELIVPPAYEMFDCEEVITKVPLYAVERTKAAEMYGFKRTDRLLVGTLDGYAYKDYWTIRK